MIEMDFVTRFTVELPENTNRGGASLAARANRVIEHALRQDGFTIKRNEGGATELHCATDVHRIELVPGGGDDA